MTDTHNRQHLRTQFMTATIRELDGTEHNITIDIDSLEWK